MDTHVPSLEASVIGCVIDAPDRWGELFIERVPVDQMSGVNCLLAEQIVDMLADSAPISPEMVVERLRVNNLLNRVPPHLVFDAWVLGSKIVDPTAEINALRGIYLSREVHALGAQITQMSQQREVSEVIVHLEREVVRLRDADAGRLPVELQYLTDMLTGSDVAVDWCMPNLIPSGTASMVTAEEGVGKSVILRQFALSAIAGLDPFSPEAEHYEPQRVLLIDCENTRNQLVRGLREQWSFARKYAPDADTNLLAVETHPQGLDLSRGPDQALLYRLVREHRPTMLVIGPVYRFTDSDLNTEEGVRLWQRPLDRFKGEGMAVLLEHHAPNGQHGFARDLRPIGSSAMRRWVVQGVGLRMEKCDIHQTAFCSYCPRSAQVERWRGARDETRWPSNLDSPAAASWWLKGYR